ncbi:hypothetical protein GCM10009624_16320 [Gordonia sinesedis]
MRAERLLSVLMLLKAHDRLTAQQLAERLEVSVRTVLRDIDALSLAGIPFYAERGRTGGFSLLPGYRTDLTGLTLDEATSLLAGTGRIDSPAFDSALRKVTAALPEVHRRRAMQAAQRVLVRPEGFVRSPPPPLDALMPVQQAVFDGRRLRMRYRPRDREAAMRVVDPIGLIVAGDVWYLAAKADGGERMYRLSRMTDVVVLDEPAARDDDVDLDALWERHRDSFRASFDPIDVVVECAAGEVGRFERLGPVLVTAEGPSDHTVRIRVRFGDRRHAARKMWMVLIECDCVVVEPDWLRRELADRARLVADRNAVDDPGPDRTTPR